MPPSGEVGVEKQPLCASESARNAIRVIDAHLIRLRVMSLPDAPPSLFARSVEDFFAAVSELERILVLQGSAGESEQEVRA